MIEAAAAVSAKTVTVAVTEMAVAVMTVTVTAAVTETAAVMTMAEKVVADSNDGDTTQAP
jgi:hypothetical protein